MGCYDTEEGGELPKTKYSDREGGLVSKEMQAFLKTEKIRHLTTLGHAHVAERTIRTITDLYYNRMDKGKEEKGWEES